MQNVLELMLYSYLLVSGLFIPVLGALFWKKSHLGMLAGEQPQF
jgi:SSS family solute:Na+ symporter